MYLYFSPPFSVVLLFISLFLSLFFSLYISFSLSLSIFLYLSFPLSIYLLYVFCISIHHSLWLSFQVFLSIFLSISMYLSTHTSCRMNIIECCADILATILGPHVINLQYWSLPLEIWIWYLPPGVTCNVKKLILLLKIIGWKV